MSDLAAPPLVVLCGGRSERMGTLKGLLDFGGRPWLEEQLRRFAEQGGREAFVGLGHFAERYRAELAGIERNLTDLAVRSVENPEPDRGPFSTLWTVLSDAVAWPRGALVLPVDVPLGAGVVRRLSGRTATAAVPTYDNRGGHPVWLSAVAIETLRSQEPATGRLDVFLRGLGDRVLRVAWTEMDVVTNLNSPEAWAEYVASRRA